MRHGTWAGYNAGCREECCREAARLYQKRRVYDAEHGKARKVSTLGLRRRIQALNFLGWSNYAIAERAGVSCEQIRQWCMRESVYRVSHEKVAAVYEQMSMSLPPETTHAERFIASRLRNKARRLGYAPPLAWDDIDNDPAPATGSNHRRRTDVDHAVVERVLAGEVLATTKAEKDEIVRRWRMTARPMAQLERQMGWKIERYGDGDAA